MNSQQRHFISNLLARLREEAHPDGCPWCEELEGDMRCFGCADTLATVDAIEGITAALEQANARERKAFMAAINAVFEGQPRQIDPEEEWQKYRCQDDTDWRPVSAGESEPFDFRKARGVLSDGDSVETNTRVPAEEKSPPAAGDTPDQGAQTDQAPGAQELDCQYCSSEFGDPICGDKAFLRDGRMLCTRPPGHAGGHVACGAHHNIGSWPNDTTETVEDSGP